MHSKLKRGEEGEENINKQQYWQTYIRRKSVDGKCEENIQKCICILHIVNKESTD